jgi:hypothetical protein
MVSSHLLSRLILLDCLGDLPPVAEVVRDGAIASVKKFLGTLALVDGAIALVDGRKLYRMKRYQDVTCDPRVRYPSGPARGSALSFREASLSASGVVVLFVETRS